ncbi:hypothetical protein PS1_009784 [Malus domestica]
MNKCLNQNMLLLWEHAQLQGGMFITDSYSTVREVDKLILVDVYLPGWPNDSTVVVSLACGLTWDSTRTEGLRGLYRGIMPEYYKVVPSVGIVFMTYETLKMLFARIQSSD